MSAGHFLGLVVDPDPANNWIYLQGKPRSDTLSHRRHLDKTVPHSGSSLSLENELSDVVNALRQALGPNLQQILLYGSWARGDATSESDVDLLVILQTRTHSAEGAVRQAVYDVMWAHDFDILISAAVLAEESFQQMLGKGYRFARRVQRDKVVLWSRAA